MLTVRQAERKRPAPLAKNLHRAHASPVPQFATILTPLNDPLAQIVLTHW
jgi:hypothetical protein